MLLYDALSIGTKNYIDLATEVLQHGGLMADEGSGMVPQNSESVEEAVPNPSPELSPPTSDPERPAEEPTNGVAESGDVNGAADMNSTNHNGTAGEQEDEAQLRREIKQNTPTRILGLHLERSPGAVQQKANDLGLSTKPTNQRPYGTKKK